MAKNFLSFLTAEEKEELQEEAEIALEMEEPWRKEYLDMWTLMVNGEECAVSWTKIFFASANQAPTSFEHLEACTRTAHDESVRTDAIFK